MKHAYKIVEAEEKTKGYLLEKFIDTLYKRSISKLMMHLLGNTKTSIAELREIKEILKQQEE